MKNVILVVVLLVLVIFLVTLYISGAKIAIQQNANAMMTMAIMAKVRKNFPNIENVKPEEIQDTIQLDKGQVLLVVKRNGIVTLAY